MLIPCEIVNDIAATCGLPKKLKQTAEARIEYSENLPICFCFFFFFERYSRSLAELEWRQQQRQPKDSAGFTSLPSFPFTPGYLVSGVVSGQRYGSLLLAISNAKTKAADMAPDGMATPQAVHQEEEEEKEKTGGGGVQIVSNLCPTVAIFSSVFAPLAVVSF